MEIFAGVIVENQLGLFPVQVMCTFEGRLERRVRARAHTFT